MDRPVAHSQQVRGQLSKEGRVLIEEEADQKIEG